MTLNPILALESMVQEYRDHLDAGFRARDEMLRQAVVTTGTVSPPVPT